MSTTEEPPNKVRKYQMESQYLDGEVTDDGQEEWLSEGGILTEDGYRIGNQTENTSVEQDDTTQESQDAIDHTPEDPGQEDQGTQEYQLIQLPNDGQEYADDGNQDQSMLQNYTLQIQTSQGIIQAQLKPTPNDDSQENITQEYSQENITQEYSQENITQDYSQENITQEYSQENITQEHTQDAESAEDNSTQYIVLPENVTLQTGTDENNTQYFILQETLPDGTVTQQNITAEDLSQYIILQQSLQEGGSLENVSQDIAPNDNVTQVETAGNILQINVLQENVSEENISQENITQENISQENITQENISEGNVSQGNVSQDNVTQDIKANTLSNIEETLDHFQREESVTPDLPDDLDTYLIMKQLPVKISQPVVTQNVTHDDDDKGNDTDDLLQILGESDNQTKKKVLTRKHKHNKKQDNHSSDDDDHIIKSKDSPVKRIEAAKNALAKKPAPKAAPETFDKSNEDSIIKKISPSVKITKVKTVPEKEKDVFIRVYKTPALQQKITSNSTLETTLSYADNQPKVIYHVSPKASNVQQKVSNVRQKVSNVQQKVSNVQQKVSNVQQKIFNVQQKVSNFQPKLSNVQPKLSNIQQKVSDFQPKIFNTQPKVSNIQPKVSNIQPKVSNIQPRLLNIQPNVFNVQPKPSIIRQIEPKITNIQQKTIYYGGQQTIQQYNLKPIQQTVPQYQQKYTVNNQQKTSHQNVYEKKIKQMYQEKPKIIPQRVYMPQKTDAIQQKVNTSEQKVNIAQQKVNATQQKVNVTQQKVNVTQQKVNIIEQKVFNPQEKVFSQHKVFGEAKSLDNPSIRAKSLLRGVRASPVKIKEVPEKPMEQDINSVDKSNHPRIMKPEAMDDESMSDGTSYSDQDSLLDYLPSSESDKMDDLFNVDIRAERAGEYLPLLGDKAHSILLQEKKRMQSIIESMKSRLVGVSNTTKRQAEELKMADIALKQLNTQLKTT